MKGKNNKRPKSQDDRIAFLQGFLKEPQQVGSIIPSSRFLEQRLVEITQVAEARTVVELGPGTGGTTRKLLKAMAPEAKLVAIEINPDFLPILQKIDDPRLIVHAGNALDLKQAIEAYQMDAPDVVLSGIPFSTLKRDLGEKILRSVFDVLAPQGRFVAYQLRDRVESLSRPIFGPAQVSVELLNIPPMRVYRWQKNSAESGHA
jgi:phosphatidylethanolamine/phosphatidyl-N-methylethanolamine N-methyltransferase